MPNTFKSNGAQVTTSNVTVYTCPALTQTTVIGMTVANTAVSDISVTVELLKNGTTPAYAVVTGAPVPTGSSLVVVGGDQKVVLQSTDLLRARTASGTADLVLSYLEIT
jgi:hypothetical protein